MGKCRTCRYWEKVKGSCQLISVLPTGSPAWVADEYFAYETTLYTRSDFGCTLHEEKEDDQAS